MSGGITQVPSSALTPTDGRPSSTSTRAAADRQAALCVGLRCPRSAVASCPGASAGLQQRGDTAFGGQQHPIERIAVQLQCVRHVAGPSPQIGPFLSQAPRSRQRLTVVPQPQPQSATAVRALAGHRRRGRAGPGAGGGHRSAVQQHHPCAARAAGIADRARGRSMRGPDLPYRPRAPVAGGESGMTRSSSATGIVPGAGSVSTNSRHGLAAAHGIGRRPAISSQSRSV